MHSLRTGAIETAQLCWQLGQKRPCTLLAPWVTTQHRWPGITRIKLYAATVQAVFVLQDDAGMHAAQERLRSKCARMSK